MVHGADVLRKEGYRTEEFGEELSKLRRCGKCRARVEKWKKPKGKEEAQKEYQKDADSARNTVYDGTRVSGQLKPSVDNSAGNGEVQITVIAVDEQSKAPPEQGDGDSVTKGEKGKKDAKEKKKTGSCRFHTGKVMAKHYTCCQLHVSKPGCVTAEKHTPQDYATGELEREWKLHETPSLLGGSGQTSHRKAVALDCEMGISQHGDSELIRVTAVDYFTGETLVDSLVYPLVPMLHFNTRYSGVDRRMLERARIRKQCIMGRDEARMHLWRFVGPETILVMHGGPSDLMSLRWIHRRIIDTLRVEASRKEPIQGRSLKHLAEVILHTQIQKGRQGHDSLEDSLACRGLLHWYVENL